MVKYDNDMRNHTPQKHWFIVLLFLLLGVLMMLGDGEASFVDVAGAAAVVVIVIAASYFRKVARPFPHSITIAWASLLVYLFVVTLFSADIGYSIRTSMRYVDAFLVYWAFYVFTYRWDEKIFVRTLTVFGSIVLIPALYFSFVPGARAALPLMSMFWSYTGHNHMTDLLLFILLPVLALAEAFARFRYLVLVLPLMLFAFFQARLALALAVIASIFFMMAVYKHKLAPQGFLFVILVCVLSVFTLVTAPAIQNKFLGYSETQQVKSSLTTRLEFYRQAVLAFGDRPLFGFGPGTFLLLSPRYERAPDQTSWFAHNYLLETAAETGIVGLGLFIWVLYVSCIGPIIRAVTRNHTDTLHIAIAGSVLLILINGLADYSLNYLVIWILFWVTSGLVSGHES